MKKLTRRITLNKKCLFSMVFCFLLIYLVYLTIKYLFSSALFQKKDRINLVVYSNNTVFYSLGLTDNINYLIPFFSDLEINVPGGYGTYRLGGISKLVELENKPDIIRKTFSSSTSTVIDYYFYPVKTDIYFGKEVNSPIFLPGFSQMIFYKSNASLIDKIYLYLLFLRRSKNQFKVIEDIPYRQEGSRLTFLPNIFSEAYRGFFYSTTYRNENAKVQLLYTKSYTTSLMLAKIFEGVGIHVVDLTQIDEKNNLCQIVEGNDNFSLTAKSLSHFLNCQITKGDTETYDIIVKLGRREKEWEIE